MDELGVAAVNRNSFEKAPNGDPAEASMQNAHSPRVTTLYELTRAILSVTDFDELLRLVTERATTLFNATGGMIRLLEGDALKIKASYGFPEEIRESLTICKGEGIAGKAFEGGRTITVNGPHEMQPIAPNIAIQTAICTPLKIGDQVIGTFGLYDKRTDGNSVVSFSEDDQLTLEAFASIAAIVIEKSIMYEETLRKEKETEEAKKRIEELNDYLEGFIENTTDAIVTTDLNGVITSWNMGAEHMYGYTREEAVGKSLPFIPDFLRDTERNYSDRVRNGETIKDIETVRKTRGEDIIDVSLTLAPIKDSTGNVIGVSGIARDITEKKRIEQDLVRRNSELSRLFFISSAMRGTLDLDKLLRMVLTAVTMGDGLGFNRAMLFLLDEEARALRGAMGVGPATHEEAWEIWSNLSLEHKSLHSIIDEIEQSPLRKDSFMDRLCRGLIVPLDSDIVLTRAVKTQRSFNVTDIYAEPLSDALLVQQLGTFAYAAVPLIAKNKVIGVLWVDNLFTRRPITDRDMEFLKLFTDQIASAIENARLFEQIASAEQELSNIFESISDLLFFTGKDYTINKVNKAVLQKLGKRAEDIVGKKCYEVFHGTHEPQKTCPHFRTLSSGRAFVEEVEDFYHGGTFLVSSSPLFDKSGDMLGTVHITRDITEIRKLREKVASAERMAALGELAAKVAHEIRNPLLSIGGFARRLEKRSSDELKEYARIIVDEVARLEEILNDTLSFVRSARMVLKEMDVHELIDNLIALLEPTVHAKGNVLLKDVQEPVTLHIDPNRFKEALLNILTNANQATDHGYIIMRVSRRAILSDLPDLERHENVLEIEDGGCGIKEEDIHRIFDPFFTTRPTGTGLGLAITKRIIEEHGGRIEVQSVPDRGTTFRVYLPVKEA